MVTAVLIFPDFSADKTTPLAAAIILNPQIKNSLLNITNSAYIDHYGYNLSLTITAKIPTTNTLSLIASNMLPNLLTT